MQTPVAMAGVIAFGLPFSNRQLAHREFVDLQALDVRRANLQAPDGEGSDGKRAHGECARGQRGDGSRSEGHASNCLALLHRILIATNESEHGFLLAIPVSCVCDA